jgi:hypothetical protein
LGRPVGDEKQAPAAVLGVGAGIETRPSGSLVDSSGNPVGDLATIEVRIAGLSARAVMGGAGVTSVRILIAQARERWSTAEGRRRAADFAVTGLLHDGDPAVRVFTDHGWRWGAYWRTPKDYQHFERRDQ